MHHGYMAAAGDDFYEDDEPLEDVLRAFQDGEKFVTAQPHQGVTLFFNLSAPATSLQVDTANPPASVIRC